MERFFCWARDFSADVLIIICVYTLKSFVLSNSLAFRRLCYSRIREIIIHDSSSFLAFFFCCRERQPSSNRPGNATEQRTRRERYFKRTGAKIDNYDCGRGSRSKWILFAYLRQTRREKIVNRIIFLAVSEERRVALLTNHRVHEQSTNNVPSDERCCTLTDTSALYPDAFVDYYSVRWPLPTDN